MQLQPDGVHKFKCMPLLSERLSPQQAWGWSKTSSPGLRPAGPAFSCCIYWLVTSWSCCCAAPEKCWRADRVGAGGQRKEMVSRCALLYSAVLLAALLCWGPPHRLGTNGPCTTPFILPATLDYRLWMSKQGRSVALWHYPGTSLKMKIFFSFLSSCWRERNAWVSQNFNPLMRF